MHKDLQLDRDEAVTGLEFHYGECTRTYGPRGGVQESVENWRRTGESKVWKTRPDDFRTPIRYGMRSRDHSYITPDNVAEFHLARRCPLETVEYRAVQPTGRIVEVSKRGGGTLGRSYADGQKWDVRVMDGHGRVLLEDVMTTNLPSTHKDVAVLCEEYADNA